MQLNYCMNAVFFIIRKHRNGFYPATVLTL